MRASFQRLLFAMAIAVPLLVASCAGVTETGNPCPGGDCEGASAPQGDSDSTYENDTFGVRIDLPAGWTTQDADQAGEPADLQDIVTVEFQSEEHSDGTTTASVTLEILDPVPSSLFDFIAEEFPDLTVEPFATSTLSGFVHDDPNPGPNGGDVREYFFLDGDLLIRVEAEIFPSTEDEFLSLLEGITLS